MCELHIHFSFCNVKFTNISCFFACFAKFLVKMSLEHLRSQSRMTSEKRAKRRSSTSDSEQSINLLKSLEDKRQKDCLERKRHKESFKAQETPEEKRARRLQEKSAKEQRRRQRMGWDTEYQHYTNQDNPFGDSNLTSTFVWTKKLEKEGLQHAPIEAVEVISRQKLLENKLELEKVKRRRLERELERQNRDEQLAMQQRVKEAAEFQEWERQEDKFHLEQARLRSVIRIQDGRAKPIDLLAQYIYTLKLEDTNEIQMHEPYVLLNGLKLEDLEDLLADIKIYVELDKGNNVDFWDDMTVIVEDEIHKIKKMPKESDLKSEICARREGIHQSVVKDVSEIFRKKSTEQLNELRLRIEEKLSMQTEGLDVSYWESLLSQLKAHMARARLLDKHQKSLRRKLNILKKSSTSEPEQPTSTAKLNSVAKETAVSNDAFENSNDDIQPYIKMYEEGNYSPTYIPVPTENLPIFTEEESMAHIEELRSKICVDTSHKDMSETEQNMRLEMRKEMTADEAEFSVEVPLDMSQQVMSEKYRPRKPRYFNRVHTGFEWNKYNQTHYDMDNPPPKIVQGYKFNIFYPDLIDKNTTPQYFLSQCDDNSDFAILRFHAGPPYEDIAFKIVHREWEFSYKRGFRCQFHNNIFQLWFHFKRYRYRR